MTKQVLDRPQVWREAERLARMIKACYSDINIEVSLQTQEDEDAYIWIDAPPEKLDEIVTVATNITSRLWKTKGIFVIPRMRAQFRNLHVTFG